MDFTQEFHFEKAWIPLEPAEDRPKPSNKKKDEKFKYASHVYDRSKHDMGIFEKYMDQLAAFQDLEPGNMVEQQMWRAEEDRQAQLSREIIKADFRMIEPAPYDHFSV